MQVLEIVTFVNILLFKKLCRTEQEIGITKVKFSAKGKIGNSAAAT